jgi:hypothetical protein
MIGYGLAEISETGDDSLDAITHPEELASQSRNSTGLVFGVSWRSRSHDLTCNAMTTTIVVRVEGIRGMYECRRLVLFGVSLDTLLFLFGFFKHLVKGVFQRRTFWGMVCRDFNMLTLVCVTSFLTSSELIQGSRKATRRDIPEAFAQDSNSFLGTIRTTDGPVAVVELIPSL